MTVLVGVRCQDGVVIGADKAVTYGPADVPQQPTLELPQGFKIAIIADQIIVATTGEVGQGQRFCRTVDTRFSNAAAIRGVNNSDPTVVATELSVAAQVEFKKTLTPWDRNFGIGGLVGMPLGREARLIYFDAQHFRPELVGELEGDRFKTVPLITMGAGEKFADPFLAHAHRILFGDTHFPTVKDARLLVAWTLDHVMRYNTGGVGGDHVDIAVLEKINDQWRAHMCDPGEAAQAVEDISKHIRDYPARLREQPAPDLNKELGGGQTAA